MEQTRGWSSVLPPLPTQFRIRDAHKRAVGYSTQPRCSPHRAPSPRTPPGPSRSRNRMGERLVGKQVRLPASSRTGEWSCQRELRATGQPASNSGSRIVPKLRRGSPFRRGSRPSGGGAPSADRRADSSCSRDCYERAAELGQAEFEVKSKEAFLARLMDALRMEREEGETIARDSARLTARTFRGTVMSRRFGLSVRSDCLLSAAACPVCHHSIQDSLVPLPDEQQIISVSENIEFLRDQKRTFELVRASSIRLTESRERRVATAQEEITALRDRIKSTPTDPYC